MLDMTPRVLEVGVRLLASDQDPKKDSEREDVRLLAVVMVAKDLWGHVDWLQ